MPIGHLAKHQRIPCEFVTASSREYAALNVGLCFIDADHCYDAVWIDSVRALRNRTTTSDHHEWAIAWHDYNERHPGVVKAVNEFCEIAGRDIQSRTDSDTVWISNMEC